VVEVLKRTVGRMRPPGAETYIENGLDRSFPSGHASVGVYVYVACALLVLLAGQQGGSAALQWSGRVLAVFGVTIGLTRIVLGVHWATDVLAGWAIGSAVLLAATSLVRPDDLVLRRPAVTTGVRRSPPEEPAA
jgi:undecaprenyl-diphosphatase